MDVGLRGERAAQTVEGDPGLRRQAKEARQLFAGIIGTVGTICQSALDRTQTDLAFAAMTSFPPGSHATITLYILDRQPGSVIFPGPFFNNRFQHQQVVGLGGQVGFTLSKVQSARRNQG